MSQKNCLCFANCFPQLLPAIAAWSNHSFFTLSLGTGYWRELNCLSASCTMAPSTSLSCGDIKGKCLLHVPCYSSWHLLKVKFELYFQMKILSLVKLNVKWPPGSCKMFTFMQYRSYEGNKQTNKNEICKLVPWRQIPRIFYLYQVSLRDICSYHTQLHTFPFFSQLKELKAVFLQSLSPMGILGSPLAWGSTAPAPSQGNIIPEWCKWEVPLEWPLTESKMPKYIPFCGPRCLYVLIVVFLFVCLMPECVLLLCFSLMVSFAMWNGCSGSTGRGTPIFSDKRNHQSSYI